MALFDTPDAAGQALPTLTPDSIKRRRLMAELMLKQGSDYSPVLSPWQGAARMANALMGGLIEGQTDQMERQGQIEGNQAMVKALQSIYGGDSTGATASAAPAAPATPNRSLPTFAQGDLPYSNAIASVESGGKYDALGPTTKTGDRAYGKYQVMGANIPSWTKEALGQSMTPQEFLASPQAQDAVFKSKFGQYLSQYGNPQDAASMWFSGRPMAKAGNASDVLGTTVPAYVAKFTKALGMDPGTQVASNDPNFVPNKSTGLMAYAAPQTGVQMPTGLATAAPDAQAAGQPAAPAMPTSGEPKQLPADVADLHPAVAQQVVTAASSPQVQQAAAQAAATPAGKQVMAQAQNMPLAALMTAMSNPWISDGQKSLLLMAAKDRMSGQYNFTTAGDTLYRTNSRTGEVMPVQSVGKPELKEVNGQLVEYDPRTRQTRLVTPQNMPTGYRPMTADEKKGAGIDANYPAFVGPDGKPVFGNPGMNIVNQSESEESRVAGKATGDRRADVENAYKAVPDKLNKIALMRQLMAGIQTGRAAGVQGTLADIALGMGLSPQTVQSMGLDPKLPIASQALDMAVNQATLGSIGQGGMPANNFSDADRNFLTKVWPSIQNRPEANDIILSVHQRAAERQLEAADSWREAQDQGKTFSQWEREWSKKVRNADLFSDVAKAAQGIGAPKPATNGQGKRLKFNPQTGQIE